MLGDPIDFEGQTVSTAGEFSRLTEEPRFAVEGADGFAYEVQVANAGNGTRGSQAWKATRRLTRAEFHTLARTSVL
jgi:hypothetical protein